MACQCVKQGNVKKRQHFTNKRQVLQYLGEHEKPAAHTRRRGWEYTNFSLSSCLFGCRRGELCSPVCKIYCAATAGDHRSPLRSQIQQLNKFQFILLRASHLAADLFFLPKSLPRRPKPPSTRISGRVSSSVSQSKRSSKGSLPVSMGVVVR